jgi:uncharacterized membrane protein YjfL (UPF0719 family)
MRSAIAWIVTGLVSIAVMVSGLMVYHTVEPKSPLELARSLTLRGGLAAEGLLIVAAGLLFLNAITGKDWFDEITDGNLAAGIVTAAVILGLTLLASVS